MIELTTFFIISQALAFTAMIFDFLSFQFKKRESTLICLAVSSLLMSLHYFFLIKITAGIIVIFSILRFVTGYFTTNKKYMYAFLFLNISVIFFTFYELFDLIPVIASCIIVIGVFQKDNKLMRKIMMAGTSIFILYNIIIFSPMGVLVEGLFLGSNILGYYRHYMRKKPLTQDALHP